MIRISPRRSVSSLIPIVLCVLTVIAGAAGLCPTPAHAFPFETFRWVWGDNGRGELGNNSDQIADHPILTFNLPTGTQLIRVAAGGSTPLVGSSSLAVDREGHVWAWGDNGAGVLGDGGSGQTAVFAPIEVCASGQTAPCTEFLSNITAVAAAGAHTLALDTFSNVWAWGSNQFGQIGSNVSTAPAPVRNNALFAQLHQLPGPPSVTAIAAGGSQAAGNGHSLALDSRGVVWAWGANGSGQLGLGNFTNVTFALPITFPAGTFITRISAGTSHSLALDTAGNVWAWGSNSTGQLGIGSFDANRNVPTKLPFFPPNTRIVSIAAGHTHSLAVDSTGKVFSWGANAAGQLGNGQNIQQNAPTLAIFPSGTPPIRTISAGGAHSLAVDADGNTWAWGRNNEGQLGNRQQFVFSNVPVRVSFPDGTHIFAIAAGGFHSLALETTAFFDDLEAVVDFDQLIQPRLLPASLTQDSIDVDTTSVALDRKGKKHLVTHTLTDTAGNTLVLALTDRRKKPNAIVLSIDSVQYNAGAVVIPPKNRIKTSWKTDAGGAIVSLKQRVFLDGTDGATKIKTDYLAAENQTRIKVKTAAGKQDLTAPGMVTLQAATMNGALGFSDGEHIWP